MIVLPIPEPWRKTLCIVLDADDADRARYLTDEESERAASFPREKRRAEWTASRIAVKLLALENGLCDDPKNCSVVSSYRKPTLAVNGGPTVLHVSISHSEWAGSAGLDARPVGIDIQKLRDLNPRATKFYLKDEEVAQMRSTAVPNPLFHFWCAKEAAFKLRAGPGWLKRVTIDLKSESAEGLAFGLSYPVHGAVDTFRINDEYVAAVARQL
jgi:phosphopantetheinyl transferase